MSPEILAELGAARLNSRYRTRIVLDAERNPSRLVHPSVTGKAAPTRGEVAAAAAWLLDDVCARRQLDADQVKILLAEWLIDTRGALAIDGLQVIGGQS